MFRGRRRRAGIVIVGALAILAPACSDDPTSAAGEETSSNGHDHSHDVGENTDNFRFVLGTPGDATAATKTVQVDARENFRFSPASLDVAAGETVTFEVTNRDEVEHEFVLGNRQYQDLHETQLKAGGVYHDYSQFSVHVSPGATASVTWTFEESGRVLYACHVAGHYDAGMVGEISIS
jgi:uncharacterized cupredoxin-like copper-binding protein